ncbi:hypothetical protein L1987_32990 [Smallanthus sonchifolius]|uniref:Uncharacterized protein n=1 Tax=Smallanthus sonchifolius TaxID=185202 RepID=A0ACB9HSE6_9ASTR|nr:hypothetical protein L1987_32990 [Smallanthus sonchifolius]
MLPSKLDIFVSYLNCGALLLHFYHSISGISEGLFNFVIGWTFMFAPLLFTDRNRNRYTPDTKYTPKKLDTKSPFLSKGIDPSHNVFDRIQIKYVEDEEGINKFFAAFHMRDTFPVLVIIDDFGDFFDERNCQQRYHSPRGRELAIVRTLALCRNAVNHANETGPCMILFSDTHHGDTPRFLHIYKRWVNSIYTIKGDGIGSYILRSNGSEMVRTKAAKYSIALQYLVLEEIYENEEQRQISC